MDDFTIKVLSWIGISMVITYRRYFLKSTERRNQHYRNIIAVSELIRKNIEKITVSIKADTDILITWIRGVEQTSAIWKTGDSKTLPVSIKFQMLSMNGKSSSVRYRIIILPEITGDKEALIKWLEENEEKVVVCDKEEKDTLTEWISNNKETIIDSIRKDTMTFIEQIRGYTEMSDESIKHNIETLIKTAWFSVVSMHRSYTIVLSKTTSNKATQTECILHAELQRTKDEMLTELSDKQRQMLTESVRKLKNDLESNQKETLAAMKTQQNEKLAEFNRTLIEKLTKWIENETKTSTELRRKIEKEFRGKREEMMAEWNKRQDAMLADFEKKHEDFVQVLTKKQLEVLASTQEKLSTDNKIKQDQNFAKLEEKLKERLADLTKKEKHKLTELCEKVEEQIETNRRIQEERLAKLERNQGEIMAELNKHEALYEKKEHYNPDLKKYHEAWELEGKLQKMLDITKKGNNKILKLFENMREEFDLLKRNLNEQLAKIEKNHENERKHDEFKRSKDDLKTRQEEERAQLNIKHKYEWKRFKTRCIGRFRTFEKFSK